LAASIKPLIESGGAKLASAPRRTSSIARLVLERQSAFTSIDGPGESWTGDLNDG
jgi:hypothetical protein